MDKEELERNKLSLAVVSSELNQLANRLAAGITPTSNVNLDLHRKVNRAIVCVDEAIIFARHIKVSS